MNDVLPHFALPTTSTLYTASAAGGASGGASGAFLATVGAGRGTFADALVVSGGRDVGGGRVLVTFADALVVGGDRDVGGGRVLDADKPSDRPPPSAPIGRMLWCRRALSR